jgi:hypothetical protein
MALGLLTAIAGTGSGFFLLNFFFSTVFCTIKELDCEHMNSQLMAQGLLTATAGTGSGIFFVKFVFFNCTLRYQ